ncbi:MAG: EamA family transporter [Gammaproteobacteria bacterium]|nr:EamA family transporter [Gammaproteobacteria bacterium]
MACLAATWLIWGSTYLAIRFALRGFAPFFLMATRFLCAGGLTMAALMVRGAKLPSLREWRNAAVVGALMLGGGMGATAFAEQTIASGLVVVYIAITPLLMILLNWGFGLRPRGSEITAVSIGLVGVIVLAGGPQMQASPAGLAAITLACCCWSLGSLLSQRGFPLAAGAAGFASEMLCGGVLLLVLSAARGEPWVGGTDPAAWLAWAYLVVFGSLIAFNAYMLLLARTSTGLATSYSLVNPLVALVLGVTLGHERVGGSDWIAAAVVMASVGLLFRGRLRSNS